MKYAKRWLAIVLLVIYAPGCANWKFLRKFTPLLENDSTLNQEYVRFEESLPNEKHWSENIATLNGIAQKKSEILDTLKSIPPTPDYVTLYNVFVEDLTNAVLYLKKEIELIQRNTEYGSWLARSMLKGSIGHEVSGTETVKAKEKILDLQEELTTLAGRCNFSQTRLEQLVAAREMTRGYKSIRYAAYKKGYVGYKIK